MKDYNESKKEEKVNEEELAELYAEVKAFDMDGIQKLCRFRDREKA